MDQDGVGTNPWTLYSPGAKDTHELTNEERNSGGLDRLTILYSVEYTGLLDCLDI